MVYKEKKYWPEETTRNDALREGLRKEKTTIRNSFESSIGINATSQDIIDNKKKK